jgi:hypothetical protein
LWRLEPAADSNPNKSSLRSIVTLELRDRRVMEDLEDETFPVAVRLEPRFHVSKKAAWISMEFSNPWNVWRSARQKLDGNKEARFAIDMSRLASSRPRD